MKDFYYIYFPIGPQFIKTLISTFKWVPENSNVIVLTNTPEFFGNLDINFNLTVLDIDELSDKDSKINEPVIKEYDNDLFIDKLQENSKKGIIFPYGKHRFIIPWLLQRNITKFVLLDSDCVLNYRNQHWNAIKYINETYKNKNLLISLPMDFISDINSIWENFSEAFLKQGISETDIKSLGNNIKMNDGWIRGFYFNDKELLKVYFELWNDILKTCYKKEHELLKFNPWTVADEWIHGLLGVIFQSKFNTTTEQVVVGGLKFIDHFYHPENDYFNLHHAYLYKDMYKMSPALSRHEFYLKNKDEIIRFFKQNNAVSEKDIKELIFDWPFKD